MVTTTSVLRDIESYLGIPYQVLELDSNEVMNIIKERTLPTFSKYYSYRVLHNVSCSEDRVPDRNNAFFIDINKYSRIYGISKLITNSYSGTGGYNNSAVYTNPMSGQIVADMTSMMVQTVTHRFLEPNILEIYPVSAVPRDGIIKIELKVMHPIHLATIPDALYDEFIELALYDVRSHLYPIRDRFNNLNTTYGSLELFMNKLDSAEDDRKTLIEKFREHSHKTSKRRKIFVG